MSLQNTAYRGTAHHRAEDDLFHYDRSRAPKPTDCDTGLSSAKASARHWVVSLRPRWLINQAQPLVRPRCEGWPTVKPESYRGEWNISSAQRS